MAPTALSAFGRAVACAGHNKLVLRRFTEEDAQHSVDLPDAVSALLRTEQQLFLSVGTSGAIYDFPALSEVGRIAIGTAFETLRASSDNAVLSMRDFFGTSNSSPSQRTEWSDRR
jgi:hypothetical protein